VLSSIPKTAAGLEKDYNQIKKDSEQVYQYVSKIPCATIEKLYKTSEIEAELLTGILIACGSHGLQDKKTTEATVNTLLSISKANNFDMTLMFIES